MARIATASILLTVALSTLPARASDSDTVPTVMTLPIVQVPPSRPAALPVLYVSLAGLQAYDIYSTRAALGRGAYEANPLMGGIADSTIGLTIVKAASTAGIIYAAERLWKRNRVGAILTVAMATGVMAAVAMNNAHTLSTLH